MLQLIDYLLSSNFVFFRQIILITLCGLVAKLPFLLTMGATDSKLCKQFQDSTKGAEYSENYLKYVVQSDEQNQYSAYQRYIRDLQDQLRAAQKQEEKQILPEEQTNNQNLYDIELEENIMLSPIAISPQNTSWSVYALDNTSIQKSNSSSKRSKNGTQSVKRVKNTSQSNSIKDSSKDHPLQKLSDSSIDFTNVSHVTQNSENQQYLKQLSQHSVQVTLQPSAHRYKKAHKRPTKDAYVQTKERRKDRVYLYIAKQYSKLKNRLNN